MSDDPATPRVSIGYHSATGPRPRNEDFVGAVVGSRPPEERRDVAAAIADGIGSAKGGRVAAETAVRGFLDGFWDVPETMEVRRAGARILDSLNGWINAQGRQDANLVGMGCTFTALVLRGRLAHLLHVGDTRAYRLSNDRMVRLTADHVRDDRGKSPVLIRALGIEAELRLDYASHHVAPTSCGYARRRRIPAGRWSKPPRSRAAATTAPCWCWMWWRCRTRGPPMSAALL